MKIYKISDGKIINLNNLQRIPEILFHPELIEQY
jgi:hypothetical protein